MNPLLYTILVVIVVLPEKWECALIPETKPDRFLKPVRFVGLK
jgi:hypothetical protein